MKVNKTISIDVEIAKIAAEKIENLSNFVENKLIEELGLNEFKNPNYEDDVKEK